MLFVFNIISVDTTTCCQRFQNVSAGATFVMQKKRSVLRNADADYCRILMHKETSAGKTFKVECEKDGKVVVINQTPTDPALLITRRVIPKVVVQEGGMATCCVLQLLPLVAAAALRVDVNECHEYHKKQLGRAFTTPGSRRIFARKVLSSMTVKFVTNSDVVACLDVLFDQTGAVWEVAQWYAQRTQEHIFYEGTYVLRYTISCMYILN